MYPTTILSRAKYYLDEALEPVLDQIDLNCSHYLSSQVTLYKQLPIGTADAQKVKLRHRRGDEFTENFNQCFDVTRLYERSLTCYTTINGALEEGHEWYAVYPPNGFKYFYNPASKISTLRDIDPALLPQVVTLSFFSEQLQTHTHLDPEVILFNMPSYFVIKANV